MSDTWRTLGNEAQITAVLSLVPAVIADDTPVLSTALDTRLYPGAEILLVALYNEVGATTHTMAFTVTESATSGGSYAAATTSGTLTATSADFVHIATIRRNEAMPWIIVTYTGSHTDVNGIAGAALLFIGGRHSLHA
jgi:hypothetical protein